MSRMLEPSEEIGRTDLKALKDGFDDPSLDYEEALIELNVRRGGNAAARALGGEFIHQLALRCERRGEIARADSLYQFSLELLEGNPHAQARTLRDRGTMTLKHLDQVSGYGMVLDALALHDQDVTQISEKGRAKGRRQRLITQTYVWRSQVIICHDEADRALEQLVRMVSSHEFQTFFVRDRKVIIDFLVPRTTEADHLDMIARQAEILFSRKKPLRFMLSCTQFAVDVQMSVARTMWTRILRKE